MCHMQSSASSKPASGRQFVPLASRLVRPASILAALLLGAGIALRGFPSGAESARPIPPPMLDEPANPRATAEVAILAGGCFWGVQGVFQHVAGVTSAISGYTGGTANTAHYGVVSTTTTGHAESVRVVFDPHLITRPPKGRRAAQCPHLATAPQKSMPGGPNVMQAARIASRKQA